MRKYEKIIKNLYRIDMASYEAFEKKLTFIPRSEEWKELEAVENELDELVKQELAALKKCISWYHQRAKSAEDFELIAELEATYDRLYEHMICDLTDEEINDMAVKAAKSILEANGFDASGLEGKPVEEAENVLTKNEAYNALNELFEKHCWLGAIPQEIRDLLTIGSQISAACRHAIQTELDRLAFEIPFQRMMNDHNELKAAQDQKKAFQLVLKISERKKLMVTS